MTLTTMSMLMKTVTTPDDNTRECQINHAENDDADNDDNEDDDDDDLGKGKCDDEKELRNKRSKRRRMAVFDYFVDELGFPPPEFLGRYICLLYTSPSPRDLSTSRMPSSA